MNTSGKFHLLEHLIVLIIISVVVALGVVVWSQGSIMANEASAISSLHAISVAETQHRLRNSVYGTLPELKDGNFISDSFLASGKKNGYLFQASPYQNEQYYWYAEAIPERYKNSGVRSFYIDELLEIKATDTGKATSIPQEEAKNWPPM